MYWRFRVFLWFQNFKHFVCKFYKQGFIHCGTYGCPGVFSGVYFSKKGSQVWVSEDILESRGVS